MGKVLVEESNLSSIASAIRSKAGGSSLYKPSEMAAAIGSIPTGITPTGTINITQNGTTDVTQYASAAVNVPNSYSVSDEGKVVSNGALVAQTARSSEITQNGTYDTTENNSIVVNVSGGGGAEDWTTLTDYIQSSGTQWIDTGYYVQDDSEFELIANVNSSSNPSYATVFGTRNASQSQEAVMYVVFQGSAIVVYNWAISQTILENRGDLFYNVKSIYRLNKSKVGVESESGSCTIRLISGGTVTDQFPLYLFNLDQGGSEYGALTRCSMKLYRFRIRESGVLVHEFVPWTDQNNVVCLKDTVTGNLKYNQGTGVFVRGTDS